MLTLAISGTRNMHIMFTCMRMCMHKAEGGATKCPYKYTCVYVYLYVYMYLHKFSKGELRIMPM